MAYARRAQLPLARVARVGVFSALAFGVNAPFLAIPNIELFSLALFLSGVFLGLKEGLAVGLVAGTIFVFFNPNGPQTILLVGLAQITGFALFGLSGGLLRRLIIGKTPGRRLAALMIFVGATLTLWYDLTTNLSFAVLFGPFWPTLIGGLGFALIHIISNAVIFGMSSLVIEKIWKRIEFYMPPLAG
jgi:hypothetical protein